MSKKLLCKNAIVDSIKKCEPIQLKIFYGMLYKFREEVKYKKIEPDEEIEFDLEEIKRISGKKHCSEYYIKSAIDNMPKEIKFISKKEYGFVGVFEYLKYNFEDKCLCFKLTENFADIMLEVLETYSIIEFSNLTALRGKYSQRLYELSRHYIKQGNYLMRLEDFKEYFDVPNNYKMCNIDYKVIKPAIKDLEENTNIRCNYTKKKKNRNITHILFNFKEDKDGNK